MISTVALHLALAALVGGGGYLLASLAAGLVGDEAARRGLDPEVRAHVVAVVEPVLRFGAGLAALAVLGVPMAPVLAVIVLAAAVAAYAARDVLRDVMAGAWLFQTRPFRAGDYVQIGDITGVVGGYAWLAITLIREDGGQVTVPTHVVASGPIRVLPKNPG